MNRNLLPLTLFGVGFLMLYSGYKGYHPIEGVLKPVLRGQKPHGGDTKTADPLTGNALDAINGAIPPGTKPPAQAPTPPPTGSAGGWSSSGGNQGISA